MRLIRYTGVLIVFLLIVIAVLVLAVRFVDINHYWRFIEGRIEAATGRDLSIDGKLRLDASMQPVVVAEQIRFSSPVGAETPDMLRIGRLEAELDLLPLLRGVVEVRRVRLADATLILERGADGRGNWQLDSRSSGESAAGTHHPGLELRDVRLNNIEVLWRGNPETEVLTRIDKGTLSLSTLASDVALDVTGAVNDLPVRAKGSVDGLWAMAVGQAGDVDFTIDVAGSGDPGQIRLNGTVPAPEGDASVHLNLAIDDVDSGIVSAFAPVRLSQLGRVNGEAVLVGPFRQLDLRSMDITTTSEDLVATLRGTARDLAGDMQLDVVADVRRASPGRLLPDLADVLPLDAEARGSLHLVGNASTIAAKTISASLSFADTSIDINGAVDDVVKGVGVNLGLAVSGSSLATLSRPAGRALPPLGPFMGTARLHGNRPDFRLEDLRVAVTDPGLDAHVHGSIGNVNGPRDVALNVRLESSKLELAELLFDRPLPGAGRFLVSADIRDSDGLWVASGIDGSLRSGGLTARLRGDVTDLAKLDGLAVDVSAELDRLETLSGLAGVTLPDLHDIRVDTRLSGKLGAIDATIRSASVNDDRLTATASGQINNLLSSTPAIDLDVNAQSSTVESLGALFDVELPAVAGIVQGNGRLLSEDDRLHLEGLDASLVGDGVDARAMGRIDDLVALKGIDLEVTAKARGASSLPVAMEALPRDLGALEFRGRLTGAIQALSVEAFTARSERDGLSLAVSGDLPDVGNPGNLSLQVSVDATSLASLNDIVGRPLPGVGPFSMTTTVAGANESWSVDALDALIDDDRLHAEIRGTVADVKTLEGIDLSLDIDAKSAAEAAAILGTSVGIDAPLKLVGKVRQDNATIHLSDMRMQLGANHVNAELELAGFAGIGTDAAQSPASLSGRIDASRIDLVSIFPETKKATRGDRPARVFSTEPLPFSWMEVLNADVDLKIDQFVSKSIVATDINTRFKLNNKALRLEPLTARLYDGETRIELIVDAGISPAWMQLDMQAMAINPGMIKALREDSPVESGLANLDISLQGRGVSTAGIASNASGTVQLDFSDLKVSGTALETIGADITLNLLRTVNPFLHKEDHMTFECGVIAGDIAEGVFSMDNTLAAQSKRLALVGSGVVNLGTEALEFAITPRPRKGLGLSASNLAKVVKIGGSLGEPRIEADPKGLLKSGAKIGAALYTGGLSVLAEGLMNRLQATDNVCSVVRRTLAQRDGESPPTQPAENDTR